VTRVLIARILGAMKAGYSAGDGNKGDMKNAWSSGNRDGNDGDMNAESFSHGDDDRRSRRIAAANASHHDALTGEAQDQGISNTDVMIQQVAELDRYRKDPEYAHQYAQPRKKKDRGEKTATGRMAAQAERRAEAQKNRGSSSHEPPDGNKGDMNAWSSGNRDGNNGDTNAESFNDGDWTKAESSNIGDGRKNDVNASSSDHGDGTKNLNKKR
jgi:hypothetical protein